MLNDFYARPREYLTRKRDYWAQEGNRLAQANLTVDGAVAYYLKYQTASNVAAELRHENAKVSWEICNVIDNPEFDLANTLGLGVIGTLDPYSRDAISILEDAIRLVCADPQTRDWTGTFVVGGALAVLLGAIIFGRRKD